MSIHRIVSTSRRHISKIALLVLVTIALVLVSIGRSRAADGRDFAGFYAVSNVADLGDTVRLTLTVRISNSSDVDVVNATVSLHDTGLVSKEYGSVPGTVSIPDRQNVRVSSEFTVSREEFERWQNGGVPFLWISFTGSGGTPIKRNVELTSGVVEEENS